MLEKTGQWSTVSKVLMSPCTLLFSFDDFKFSRNFSMSCWISLKSAGTEQNSTDLLELGSTRDETNACQVIVIA